MEKDKYRAWDKLNERFEYFDLNKPETMPVTNSAVYFMPRQQFTGLKDKKGKEIYEGDIIKMFVRETICTIEYLSNYGGFMVCWGKANVLHLENRFGFDYVECEKIGDIHDNKDFLNN